MGVMTSWAKRKPSEALDAQPVEAMSSKASDTVVFTVGIAGRYSQRLRILPRVDTLSTMIKPCRYVARHEIQRIGRYSVMYPPSHTQIMTLGPE